MRLTSRHNQDSVKWAVQAALTGTAPLPALASDLGVSVAIIRGWIRDAIDQSPYRETFELLTAEVSQLRRENAELRKVVARRHPASAVAGSTSRK